MASAPLWSTAVRRGFRSSPAHLPPAVTEAFDLSGAGDTVVSALAAGLAIGLSLPVATRLANLAMGVAAGQAGMAVAQGTDLMAMLTPQGRALRKIVGTEIALEQVVRWRRAGLRTGLLAANPARLDRSRLDAARAACDRLVLAVEAPPSPPADTAHARSVAPGPGAGLLAGNAGLRRRGHHGQPGPEAAAWPAVDMLCLFANGEESDTIQLLRPELVIDASPSADLAELVRSWGGVMVAG